VLKAIDQALHDVRTKNTGEVPKHLRDSHYSGAGELGHGNSYLYPHHYPGHYVKQQYLPDPLVAANYYQPSDQGKEKEIAARWKQLTKCE
jgi:putative ATPase